MVVQIWSFNCHAQNKTTKDGLKVGRWVEENEGGYEKFKETGYYKIVPLSKYDTLGQLEETTVRIKYKHSSPLLFFYARHDNYISVKDSVWQALNLKGKLLETTYWIEGINIWRKLFDDDGNLIEYDYDDLENDTSFYLTYISNQLFKKELFPPNDKNNATIIFYPDNRLIIPKAELSFYSKFSDISVNVFSLKLSCRQEIIIKSVTSSSNNIQVSFPYNSVPYKLASKDTATFQLIFTPTPISFRTNDTITIVTSEQNIPPYKIYCSLRASHIDGSNVGTIKEIVLSRTEDRYLIISPMGTRTDAVIKDTNGSLKKYVILSNTKIDLEEFQTGEYGLAIYSCNTGGDIKLKIIE